MLASDRFPDLGDSVPRRGNRFARALARVGWALAGWQYDGQIPNVPKCIFAVYPHTSNWDFLVGITTVYALGFRASFLGKRAIFRWPLGCLMRWLGGISVDRRAPNGAVGQVIDRFKSSERLLLGLSPEGTRKQVDRWKTGFYYIALGAEVPIVPVAFDYSRKLLRFGEPLTPSGNLAADLEILSEFFAGAVGKRSHKPVAAEPSPTPSLHAAK